MRGYFLAPLLAGKENSSIEVSSIVRHIQKDFPQ